MGDNKYVCPFCGRNNFKNKNGYVVHVNHCKSNPNRTTHKNSGENHPMYGKHHDEETRLKCGNSGENHPMYGKHHSDNSKQKMSKSHIGKPSSRKGVKLSDDIKHTISLAVKNAMNNDIVKQKISNANTGRKRSLETQLKMDESKRRNNSFNSSKIECELKNYFNSNNILYITQYKNNLYPFCCDFYFPDKDLYVEIQGCWTHGGRPYISTDKDCIEQLELWKSKNTGFYNSAISTWTVRDVKKRETAKMNNLNWIEIFSKDLDVCLKIILNNL